MIMVMVCTSVESSSNVARREDHTIHWMATNFILTSFHWIIHLDGFNMIARR